jgi:WD40 repeat protein
MGFRCDPDGNPRGEWELEPHVDNETLCGFVGTGDRFVTVDRGALIIRDTATGGVRATVPYPSYSVCASAASPDGRRLAVMGYDKLYIWQTAVWGKPLRINTHGRSFTSLAFHPTRPILAAIQYGQTLIKFLDADTGKTVSRFQWKLGTMRAVAFSSDGTLAAAGSEGGKIVVWDVDE